MSVITARPLTAVPLTARPLTAYALGASTSGAAFSPLDLFASGEQGGWWDASDFSTMFQDSAGTTPVTAVEQPVGKHLDKSGRGNHRSQATTTKRPVLSARVNLLTYSEDFSNADWLLIASATRTSNYTTAPDGSITADRLQLTTATTDGINQLLQLGVFPGGSVASKQITFSVYLKSNTGANQQVRLKNTHAAVLDNFQAVTVTPAWQRFSITVTNGATAGSGMYGGVVNSTDALAKDISMWGAQCDVGPSTTYQRIAAATVYDSVGFPHYLKYDGVDDFLATAAVDFTATDTVTVWAGTQKNSDAAARMLLEHGATTVSTAGTFGVSAPISAAASFSASSRGTATVDNTVTTYASPYKAVLTMKSDISTPNLSIAVNAGAFTDLATSQGTGNYTSQAIYFGARAGTSLFYSGHEYQTVILGRAATAGELADTLAYVNELTEAY